MLDEKQIADRETRGLEGAETQQKAFGDSFWGIDKELQDQLESLKRMSLEDQKSREFEEAIKLAHQHRVWEEMDEKRREEWGRKFHNHIFYLASVSLREVSTKGPTLLLDDSCLIDMVARIGDKR